MTTFFISRVVFLLAIFNTYVSDGLECNTYKECSSTSVSDSGNVYCNAYFSCFDAISITSDDYFRGYGAYSAYQTNFIDVDSYAICQASSSCREILYLRAYNSIFCRGYRSCFESSIVRSTLSRDDGSDYSAAVSLSGFESGAYSTITLHVNSYVNILFY